MIEWSNPRASKAAIKNLRQALRNRGEELEAALARAERAEAEVVELRAKVEGVVSELESRASLYDEGEANDRPERIIRTRGLAAGSRDAAGLLRSALASPSPAAASKPALPPAPSPDTLGEEGNH